MDKMDKYGMDLEKVNIERLKEIFPECVTDGKVNFDVLRTILGDDVETSGEKYSFNWVGKSDAMKIALMPSTGTLRPCKDKSKDWDKTENLYIEGDNLEVLKTLEKTYHNQIKMIYIDPPYNTGKDFVYHDDFHDNVSNYLENSAQAFRTNPETAGRFHTDWLNMMYPRLKIARELLKDEGAIFISIDENELKNLGKLCDEIFGEENFVECFVYDKKAAAKGVPPVNMVCGVHEYIFVYAKDYLKFKFIGVPRSKSGFSNPDNDPRGIWRNTNIKSTTSETSFPIVDPKTGNVFVDTWAFSQSELEKMIKEQRLIFPKNSDGQVRAKEFYYEFSNANTPIKSSLGLYDAQWNTEMLVKLMDGKFFQNPKHLKLMRDIIAFSVAQNEIIMDFFSGSSTTAHAVMDLNFEDGGKRKFIMVQLPEACDESSEAFKAGYSNICEIGEERIRRAGDEIIKLNRASENTHQVSLFEETKIVDRSLKDLDVGFKVFKLDSTNIKPWDATVKYDETTLYDLQDSVVKEDRSNLDIAYEVMLKYGIFNMPLEEKEVNGKTVYSVGEGYMIISLNDEITTEDVAAIAALGPKAVVFKESGFVNDNAKMNADYTFKRLGIDNVKCI